MLRISIIDSIQGGKIWLQNVPKLPSISEVFQVAMDMCMYIVYL